MSSRRQYLLNIIWSWAGAATLLVNGAVIAPYLIRRMGAEEYGIWAFGLSFVEYFWMIDLGVRQATVRLTAEYDGLGQRSELNGLLSTAATYSGGVGLIILLSIYFGAGWIARFFHISHPGFPLLLHVVSISWAFGLIFNVFGAGLEGLQRFDVTNHVFISFTAARSISLLLAVHFGFGLKGMTLGLLVTQLAMYGAFYVALRRELPELRISLGRANRAFGHRIWIYARQLMSGMLSARLLTSAIPSLITYFLGVRNVTYYSNTQKTLDYAGEGIGRFGTITGPRAAALMARGLRPQVMYLGEYGNRYCLMLWLLFATFFAAYAYPFFQVWINTDFADSSHILLKLMLFGYTLWLGQFASAAILMGIGRYSEYSASLLIEAVITVIGFGLLLPRYGLVAGVAVYSVMIAINRCANLSRIYCKEFNLAVLPFLWRVYRTPLMLGTLDLIALFVIKRLWVPGRNWPQLIAVGTINAAALALAGFWLVLEPEHRSLVVTTITEKFRGLTTPRNV